jgi:hypothetical protein
LSIPQSEQLDALFGNTLLARWQADAQADAFRADFQRSGLSKRADEFRYPVHLLQIHKLAFFLPQSKSTNLGSQKKFSLAFLAWTATLIRG